MVRLVFRPYTQIWRSICTSESLRASIWVSSDFTLFRHSSPSFGSQQICSYSNLSGNHPDRSMMLLADLTSARRTCLYFHCACGFATQRLAYMLDSLVRVSRRVRWHHFANIRRSFRAHPTGVTAVNSALGFPKSSESAATEARGLAQKGTTCDSSVRPGTVIGQAITLTAETASHLPAALVSQS